MMLEKEKNRRRPLAKVIRPAHEGLKRNCPSSGVRVRERQKRQSVRERGRTLQPTGPRK